jgi:hypothetical protein
MKIHQINQIKIGPQNSVFLLIEQEVDRSVVVIYKVNTKYTYISILNSR